MLLEDNIRLSLLFDLYGALLTKKQFNYLDGYLNKNLSLTELGELYSSSRQAVNELIKRSIKILEQYDKKLFLLNKFEKIKNEVNLSLKDISKENQEIEIDKIKKHLNNIMEVL